MISSSLFLLGSFGAVQGLILDACVPIFKMLYPSSNTTSSHAHISIHTLKSCSEYQQQESPPQQEIQWLHADKTEHCCRPFCITCLWSHDASYWRHTSLKDMTVVGATYQMILKCLMLQSCQLCDIAHDFWYDPRSRLHNVATSSCAHLTII